MVDGQDPDGIDAISAGKSHELSIRATLLAEWPKTYSSEIQSWYRSAEISEISNSSHDIMAMAYHNAKMEFEQYMTNDPSKIRWLRDKSSIVDVLEALKSTKIHYESKPKSKARKWLGIFSERVSYYGKVFDVLIQQYPEYVSLVWGAMKFLFTAINNQEEKVKQLAKALSKIAEILPRSNLALVLYPTALMKDSIAILYSKIINFIQRAMKWYKQGSTSHALSSITRPWALNFQDYVDEISIQSRYVDKLAEAASQAEQRDIHMQVLGARTDIEETRIRIEYLAKAFDNNTAQWNDLKLNQQVQIGLIRKALEKTKLFELEEEAQRSSANKFEILQAPALKALPSAEEAFAYCDSLKRRNGTRSKVDSMQLPKLQRWESCDLSSIILLQGNIKQPAKHVLIDFISLLRSSNQPVVWILRFADHENTKPTGISILQTLVSQCLSFRSSFPDRDPYPITMAHLNNAFNEVDWLQILNKSLAGFEKIYIALDSSLLAMALDQSRFRVAVWVENLVKNITSTQLKLVLPLSDLDVDYIRREWNGDLWDTIKTDQINKKRRRRRRKNRTRI